jgi:hypothetical protein
MLKIVLVSGILFALGGDGRIPFLFIKGWNAKLWRWLMGGFIGLLLWHGVIVFGLCLLTYWIATSVFGYGDKSILKFLPQNWKHFVSGLVFGLASFPIVGIAALWQGVVSGIAFYIIEVKRVNNPWAELLRGGLGTLILALK